MKNKRLRLVYRRSSLAVKCVILATVVLCTAALIIIGVLIRNNRIKTEQARARAAELEQKNSGLQQDINELGTPQSTQRIAYEELGLVDPDTIIFETTQETE